MTARTRAWLREFLDLGARAEQDGIPSSEVGRQEETVLKALDMLDSRPGIMLADEVGMGKTYEALGVAAATRHSSPRCRIAVVTPGPDLNKKWSSDFSRFREMYDFGDEIVPVSRLGEFVRETRRRRPPVVAAPVTMFQSGKGVGDQTYLLSLYFEWKGLHGRTANAIMARFRDGEHERLDVTTEKFLGVFDRKQVSPHLPRAFRRGRRGGDFGLDDLYKRGRLQAFENETAVRKALYRARFELAGRLMPVIDLLIVDEAHKLKNPGSLRTRAMRQLFKGRFRKALFLTATPFQLEVDELREVFSPFAGAKGAPKDLGDEVDQLLSSVREYQNQYEEFQRTWSTLVPEAATQFRIAYDRDPAQAAMLDEPALAAAADKIAKLKELKQKSIEPGFRRWMIRSLKEEKREYRRHREKHLRAVGAGFLPFLIYERFIAELFRRRRQTYKAAVEINMVSSYAAASQGAILSSGDIPSEAEPYRDLLREILGEIESSPHDHPKIQHVIKSALNAAEDGEKTLIFCSRIATLGQLRAGLNESWQSRVLERWRRVYPGAEAEEIFDAREKDDKRQRGRHSSLQARIHRPQDALYLGLREPYLRTIAPVGDWALRHLREIVQEANSLLRGIWVRPTSADRLDYQIAKRCVEQAAAKLSPLGKRVGCNTKSQNNLLAPEFLNLGLDLVKDDLEEDSTGSEKPRWRISERVAKLVVGEGGSLWELKQLKERLDELDIEVRVRVVERLARYLTYRQVPFLADLLHEARTAGLSTKPVESVSLLSFMPGFWGTAPGRRWIKLLTDFLEYLVQRSDVEKREILDGPIRTGDFARDTRDGESRERLRDAFNTPLYPMILIANEVMQEGLDLHKHCRRIVHHDLVWNPAQIEQRIGRVDRLGSLTSRLRGNRPDVSLEVLYPIICGTIDERLFRTVKTREKWLEFLLGASPNFAEYSFTDEEPPPLPERLSRELRIDLSPENRSPALL